MKLCHNTDPKARITIAGRTYVVGDRIPLSFTNLVSSHGFHLEVDAIDEKDRDEAIRSLEKKNTISKPPAPLVLREDGPTIEEFVSSGYDPKNYPPAGYATVASAGLTYFEANGVMPPPPAKGEDETRVGAEPVVAVEKIDASDPSNLSGEQVKSLREQDADLLAKAKGSRTGKSGK